MLPHSLTTFEIQKYHQNEPKFNSVYSRSNLPKIKDEACVILNFDECISVGTHWIALYVNGDNVSYFDSFGVENVSKEIKKFNRSKNITTNIDRMQANNSVMC